MTPIGGGLPEPAAAFVAEALRRAEAIDCFDFVPSNHRVLHSILDALPRGRLCEWGSGIGIGVGLAEMLGFDARGIEIDPALSAASRELLADFGLAAVIETGSYLDSDRGADVYFAYCWPGQVLALEAHFASIAPREARLLICNGADDIRCKVRPADLRTT